MGKSQVAEGQTIGVLRWQEYDATMVEVCCQHGISKQTFHCVSTTFGGMSPSDAGELRTLGAWTRG